MARSLLPREHGAYAALAFPSVTGLAIGRLTASSLLLVAAAILAFVAHESLLVALGARGKRALAEAGRRARTLLVILGAMAAAAAVAGMALAPGEASRACAVPAAFALVTGAAILAGREKTLAGELCALGGLVSVGLPVAIAAAVPTAAAAFACGVWALSFAATTIAVRAMVAKPRPRPWVPGAMRAAAAVVGLVGSGAALALAIIDPVRWIPAAAALPCTALAASLALGRVHPRRLRQVGWTIVAADVATLVALVWSFAGVAGSS